MTRPLVEKCASHGAVIVIHLGGFPIPRIKNAEVVKRYFGAFGFHFLTHFLRSEITAPTYVKGLSGFLEEKDFRRIFLSDFHKFVFWQCVRYVKKHPKTKLYLFSNIQHWPHNIFARIGMLFFWWYFKANLSHVEKIFVHTERGKKFLEARLPGKEIVLCPTPIDTAVFFPDENKTFMRDGTLRVLMNARYVAYKNHQDLFEAVALCKDVPIKVSCIGTGGHLEESLKRYAKELGIENRVSFLAPVPREKIRDLYTAHDVLVLPSRDEELGLVVPEAMACGIPTVTSDTVGANVYVREGETGLVFKTGDVVGLAEKLREIASPEKLKAFGTRARKVMEEHYALETGTKDFWKAIEK